MVTLTSAPTAPRPQPRPQFPATGPAASRPSRPTNGAHAGQPPAAASRDRLAVPAACWSTARNAGPERRRARGHGRGPSPGPGPPVATARAAEARAGTGAGASRRPPRPPPAGSRCRRDSACYAALRARIPSATRCRPRPASGADHTLLGPRRRGLRALQRRPSRPSAGRRPRPSRARAPAPTALTRVMGSPSASGFPGLLDGVARHALRRRLRRHRALCFVPWTTAVTVPDFRSTIATVVSLPRPTRGCSEHAEYIPGSPFGPTVPVRLTNFGRLVHYTRAAALRDDVADFAQLQQALGVAAASIENDTVYNLLNQLTRWMADWLRAVLRRSIPTSCPSRRSTRRASPRPAPRAPRTRKHGRPAFLLVGTADGAVARNLVTLQTPPNAGEASGVLEVVQDDRITGAFYVTCDPAERPTLVTAHLAGIDGPELLTQDGWDVDARLLQGARCIRRRGCERGVDGEDADRVERGPWAPFDKIGEQPRAHARARAHVPRPRARDARASGPAPSRCPPRSSASRSAPCGGKATPSTYPPPTAAGA